MHGKQQSSELFEILELFNIYFLRNNLPFQGGLVVSEQPSGQLQLQLQLGCEGAGGCVAPHGGPWSPASSHCGCHMPTLCQAGAKGIPLAALHSHTLGFLLGVIHPCRADPWALCPGSPHIPPTAAVLTTPAGDKGNQGTRGAWGALRAVRVL